MVVGFGFGNEKGKRSWECCEDVVDICCSGMMLKQFWMWLRKFKFESAPRPRFYIRHFSLTAVQVDACTK